MIGVAGMGTLASAKHAPDEVVITEYGPSLAENLSEWQPETLEARKAMLAEESKYVSYFKQTDLPGYAGFGEKSYDSVNISALLESSLEP